MSGPGCTLEPSVGKFSVFCLSLAIPQFGFLPPVSSLRLSLGHSGLILQSTSDAVRASLSSFHSLVAAVIISTTSLLAVVVRSISCGFYFSFFLPVMLPSQIPKLPIDLPVRGFPIVRKLLLQDSLTRTGFHP